MIHPRSILLRLGVLPLVVMLALVLVACEDEIEPSAIAGQPVWNAGERAEYTLLDGKKELGQGVLSVEREGDALVLRQQFTAEKITDSVAVYVTESDQKPRKVTRVIDGDDGKLTIDVEYGDERITVHADNGEERRSFSGSLPQYAYDNWQGLFLWRTLPLADDYSAAYVSVATAAQREPERGTATVRVKEQKRIRVPAGEFTAWEVKINSSGGTETAWIAVDAPHPVVRYDNGSTVFELTRFTP